MFILSTHKPDQKYKADMQSHDGAILLSPLPPLAVSGAQNRESLQGLM